MKPIGVLIIVVLCINQLVAQTSGDHAQCPVRPEPVIVGAESTSEYFPLIKGKRIGIFSNQTGIVNGEHLVDFLKRLGFRVSLIFSPEHGFRGDIDAGDKISNGIDAKTDIPIYSLYQNKTGKPDSQTMSQIDILLVDIQDVGLRFYTYYISLYKLMDACAESNKKMIILDRPNPNGFYVDGPILDMKHKSEVGYLPIPVVHGMTLGELAQMINGEKWLPQKRKCDLHVIKNKNYTHQTKYQLPVPPSPNLPNMQSVYLYPSTCLFEGTTVSLGRGTAFPFQVYGSPYMKRDLFSFTPRSIPGAKNPPYLDEKCYGVDLRSIPTQEIWEAGINLNFLIDAYNDFKKSYYAENEISSHVFSGKFFTSFFEKLIGVDYVREMIIEGKSNNEIKAVWREDVEKFKIQRRIYLLYEE
jgi:uncharacterized protein YbbC (DUF1343 family)